MYNFTGTGDDELSFQKGDLIMVTKVCVCMCVRAHVSLVHDINR